MTSKIVSGLLTLAIVSVVIFSAPLSVSANSDSNFGYGGGNEKITICKKTGSPFNPYVKITVPKFVGEQFIHQKDAIALPANGKCPQGISLRDYMAQLFHRVFNSNVFAKEDNNSHDNNSKGNSSKDNNKH